MSYSICFAPGLDDDLAQIRSIDINAAALWLELINAIYDVEAVANELMVDNGYRFVQPRFDTVPVGVLLRRGYNVSRIKLYKPDGTVQRHRLLYALDYVSSSCTICLLGLMERVADYDIQHPYLQRICRDYDDFGVAKIPRG